MCGIAAMIAFNGAKIDPVAIDRMSTAIKHRGPDDLGKFISDSVGFGFRRLSIIDLSSAANQPMASEDGQTILIFNGEIFNYVELRAELQSLGFVFKTRSDTEVLLNAYRKWGYDCLNKLNGMWAFIIYDVKESKIFVSRDRFGVKPLYMYRYGDFVFFGSEIKAIIASGYYKGDINWKIASKYLISGGLDQCDETFYSGIERIPAGFAFELDLNGRLNKKRYWSLDNLSNTVPSDPARAFFEIFEDAVKIRLRSDVPLGVCLSGGLDSTSIICSIARQNANIIREKPDLLQAFCYFNEDFDESDYINDTLRLTGAHLNRFQRDPKEFWDILNRVMWHSDEPIHSMVGVVIFELYKLAALKGMKVMLTGQGGDESLAGYPSYFDDYWYALLKKGLFRDVWREIGAYCAVHGGNRYDIFRKTFRDLYRMELNKYAIYRKLKYWRQHREAQNNSWFTPEIIELSFQGHETQYLDTTLNESLRYSIEVASLPEYLRLEDRVSMAHSIEARLPFMDYRLISLAFSLPDNWKIRGPWNKYVLREAMRGHIPESVRRRPDKMGFPVSQNKWFADVLYEPMQDILRSSEARHKKIYNVDMIIKALEGHQKGKVDISKDLFKVVQFELFCQVLKKPRDVSFINYTIKKKPIEFRCPQCCGEIIVSESHLFCKDCQETFSVNNGIIDFRYRAKDYYFNPVPAKEMDDLIYKMSAENWPYIIRTFLKYVNYNNDWLVNLVSDGRYAWKTLLNLTPDTVLLDLGCGLGNSVKNISSHVGKVYAMDLTYKRLEFTKKMLDVLNRGANVTLLAGGDGAYLPFAENSIDCVVLSGVLEWIGEDISSFESRNKFIKLLKMTFSCFGKNSPRVKQLKFLKEIRRVLKTQGQIFIAIENRLNLEYFLGRPDHHSGLKYASLLPRFLSNLYSIAVSRMPYRTYTYSIKGYKKLLSEAGFSHANFFALWEGYNNLKEIYPIGPKIPHWHYKAPRNIKDKIKRNQYFIPAYGIVAGDPGVPSLQDRLFKQIETAFAPRFNNATIILERYFITDKNKGILMASIGRVPIVIRIPFNSKTLEAERQNCDILHHIKSSIKTLPYCPESLTHGESQGLSYFVETRLKGELLANLLIKKGRTALLNIVENVLENLNPHIKEAAQRMLIDEFYEEQVSRSLQVLFQVIEEEDKRKVIEKYFHKNLYGVKVPCGLRHGDFTPGSILIQNGKASGLIDWEYSHKEGLPILDAIHYLESAQRLFSPKQILLQIVPLLASNHWPVSDEWDFLKRQYARFGMNESFHKPLVYLNWAQATANQLEFTDTVYNEPWIKSNIKEVANLIISQQS